MNPDDYKKRDWLADLIKDEYNIDYENLYLEHVKKNYEDFYGQHHEKPKYKYDPSVIDWEERVHGHGKARFSIGDLLSAGGIVALVVSVADGLNGWKYSVKRDGELMHVDEVALNEWQAI